MQSSLWIDVSVCFSLDDSGKAGNYDDEKEGEKVQEWVGLDGSCSWEGELSVKCCGLFPGFGGWDLMRASKGCLEGTCRL